MALYDYTPDINPLDDEEERRRREREMAAMAAENDPMGRGAFTPSFGDVASQAFNQRLNVAKERLAQAGQMFTDPTTAFQQRMLGEQQQAAQDEAANTEVKTQTVKTYQDGSQERVVKTQVPAGQPQAQDAGARLTTPIAGMPQNLPAAGPISPEDAQRQIQMAQMPQPGPSAQVAGATQMPPQAQPRPQPQQFQRPMGAMPPANYGMATGQGQPGIRMPQAQAPAAVAAAPGASLAQQGQAAQAQPPVAGTPYTPTAEREVPQPAAWVQSANDAGTDLAKLFDVAARHPESRDMIMGKMQLALKNKTKEDEANELFKAAAAGNIKAQNQIFQQIKPETGKAREEVTTSDYVKAILFKRLGLDALALDVENKIRGKDTKFGQISFGGSNWETETDSTGRIIRAKDDQGTIATEATLNKLRAGGEKFGAQSSQYTGGIHTVPNAKGDGQDLVMPIQNTVDPTKTGFVYMSGPNKGQPYNGTATPQPQSVGTNFQKALDKAMIDFQTAPSIAGAKAAMEKAAVLDPGDNSLVNAVQQRINAVSPDIFKQAKVTSPSGSVSDRLPADAAAIARNDRDLAEIDRQIVRANQSTAVDPTRKAQQLQVLNDERNRLLAQKQSMGGATAAGGSLAAQEAAVKTNAAIKEARLKPPATKEGEIEATNIANQNTANEAYGMIAPVADLIKQSTGSGVGTKIDKLAGFFGVGTKGAQAIAQLDVMSYPFKYSIPRFEGPQGEKDVAIYEKAAGDFANPEKPIAVRLAALQGMIFMLKKYDKAGTNDWTYGGANPAQQGTAQPGTTSSGNKFKKVQ